MGTRHWPEDADEEVERLGGVIVELLADLEKAHLRADASDSDYLDTKADNQRLREALENLITTLDGVMAPDHPMTLVNARQALKEGTV